LVSTISSSVLDTILAFQVSVAWAGESREHTKRLGWWQTDLVDATGGGDFMARLLPRTHAWAALEAVREAARRVDEQARRKAADPDAVRTLYFLGFELDERLAERLAELKRAGAPPDRALPLPLSLSDFNADAFAAAVNPDGKAPSFEVVPGGRQMKGPMPAQPDQLVRALAAALLPLGDAYPAPFFRVKG
jgi:hypothetical protein